LTETNSLEPTAHKRGQKNMGTGTQKPRVAIAGATGYAGQELLRNVVWCHK